MEPRLIKGLQAEYIPAEYPGSNTSGIRVLGKNVLVRVDECSPRTSGKIELIETMVEQMTMAATTGVVCAVGPEAFRLFDDGTRWTGRAVEAGERVWFEKYAGQLQTGRDGATYRIMDYRAIAGAMEDEPAETIREAV